MFRSRLISFVVATIMMVIIAHSLHAAEYENTKLGFSITYPNKLDPESPPSEAFVFYATSAMGTPYVTVSIVPGATLQDAAKAAFASDPVASNLVIKDAKQDTTKSGINAHIASLRYTYKWQEYTNDYEGLILGVQKDGKWVLYSIAAVPMYDTGFDLKEYEKILKSIKFNK